MSLLVHFNLVNQTINGKTECPEYVPEMCPEFPPKRFYVSLLSLGLLHFLRLFLVCVPSIGVDFLRWDYFMFQLQSRCKTVFAQPPGHFCHCLLPQRGLEHADPQHAQHPRPDTAPSPDGNHLRRRRIHTGYYKDPHERPHFSLFLSRLFRASTGTLGELHQTIPQSEVDPGREANRSN